MPRPLRDIADDVDRVTARYDSIGKKIETGKITLRFPKPLGWLGKWFLGDNDRVEVRLDP